MFAQNQDSEAAQEVIEAINQWRVENDLWPLKPNPTLERMAIDQARFVLTLPTTPADIHAGRNGESPRQRARLPQYNWPSYTLPGQIAIGENGASGSLSYAMRFWRNSPLHRETALNADYREIGVAAVPNRNGHFYLVVFGSRPNVLPALVDASRQWLYLTSEEFEYARMFNTIGDVTRYRLFDAAGRPLTSDWQTWASTVALPAAASTGDKVYVLYSDGNHEALSEVNLSQDVALLPDDGGVVAVAPTVVPTTQAAPPAETEVTAPPAPTETEVPAPTPIPADPDILLLYNGDTINLLNVSGGPLDVTGLEIGSGDNALPVSKFARVADIALSELPNNHCVQARDVRIQGMVDKPESCSWVRSLLYIVPDDLFWGMGDFIVQREGVPLATCSVNAGQCPVALP